MAHKFVQAKNFTRTNGRQIDLCVIHDMETPEDNRRAENVASWFAGRNAPRASAHWCFDPDSAVQCVLDKDVAWAAPGANHNGLQYELAGYAKQTREQWLDASSIAIMEQCAAIARGHAAKYDIPLRWVDAAGLLRGERGFTTHLWVTNAFKLSTHWDPGYGFPHDVFLKMVGDSKAVPLPSAPSPIAAPSDLLRSGSRGEEVKVWQGILIGAGHKIAADGIFGVATKKATQAFQKALGVGADGVVGPATRAATAKLLNYLKALERPSKPQGVPPLPGNKLIRKGDRGDNVRAVQQKFKDRGWRISVDGVFGGGTEKVVRAFQKEKGLAIDGIVGSKTWNALWTAPVT